MAPILQFGSRMFRTRSLSRDSATDMKRLASVRAAVLEAIEGARKERDGLQQRIETYQMQAASLLDNTEYGQRTASEESAISAAEQQVVAGFARVKQITSHIADLGELLVLIEGRQIEDRQSA